MWASQLGFYHVNSDTELAIVQLLLQTFCVFDDPTIASVTVQGSIISALLNLFSGYHGALSRSLSRLDFIGAEFLHPCFQDSLVALLEYVFNVNCRLLNLAATASLSPASPGKTLAFAANRVSRAVLSPAPSPIFCINLAPKTHSAFSRRHCLSKSITRSLTTPEPPSLSVPVAETAALSPEEIGFDWTTLVMHLLQYIQGVLAYDESICAGWRELLMRSGGAAGVPEATASVLLQSLPLHEHAGQQEL